ncbi:MAG: alkaline phosphatase D family protein [Burkholderiales bacterium]|nr:alkaline phosphatase D family protein [Burkholderiales bacterium]
MIVGSGYGGSMAAAELAGATVVDEKTNEHRPLTVCLLERGEEYQPGEFPSHFGELPRHVRVGNQASGKVTGFHQGLFDLRLGPDVAALVANGLGGGSLINAGVMLAPRAADFEQGSVMRHLVDALHSEKRFDCARERLGGTDSILSHAKPAERPSLPAKTIALQKLAAGRHVDLPPITVSMRGGPNHAGVTLAACTLCGDCLTGCNIGAKDSLDVNLLAHAARAGVRIHTGATVLSIRRALARDLAADEADHWVLRVVHTDPRLQAREREHLRVRARKVILSAGTLGSAEILLRSRDDKLVFSSRLGEGFSCNGDNIAVVHRMPEEVNGRADPQTSVQTGARTVGPTITGSIPIGPKDEALGAMRHEPAGRGFLVQEFSVPAALRQFFDELVTTRQILEALPTKDDERHGTPGAKESDPMAVDAQAMQRSLLVGIIGHDDAAGVLRLSSQSRPRDRPPQQGTLMISWPQARDGRDLNASHAALKHMVAALQGAGPTRPSLVANPMWRLLPDELAELVSQPRGPVLTVHALGGCAMGRNQHDGVVDEYGRVFDAEPGDHTWQGDLVVLDGSIIPGSLGVNPSLTIAATALRAMNTLMREWEFQPFKPGEPTRDAADHPPAPPIDRRRLPLPALPTPMTTKVEIVERLRGQVQLHAGGSLASPCIVDLTLYYQTAELATLSSATETDRSLTLDADRSRLRIFDQTVWEHERLRFEPDSVLSRHAVLEASLSGSLRFLHREASTPWRRIVRTIPAWLLNRGARDWFQLGIVNSLKRLSTGLGSIGAAASRAGEVRRFDYVLRIDRLLSLSPRLGGPRLAFEPGDEIRGTKRLTYGRRANPWRQLSELTITRMPDQAPGQTAVLTLDLPFMAQQGFPLVKIVAQQDHAQALADLASMGLYLMRVIANCHLWSFRKPDQPDQTDRREPIRLPGPIAGLAPPEITELKVGLMPDSDQPVVVRLTHYRHRSPASSRESVGAALPPLVMIHGYSASGTTFTHPSLSPSAAEFFCRAGRDVWVVDLRSSAGMPTAGTAWALEEPALVDIPAALLHIRQLSGQPVDVLAHCIGAAMLSMAILTQATDVRGNIVELGTGVWLTDEQLGTLRAFNGPGSGAGSPHPCIRRIVLSQKGPLLRYSDANVFRSFILSRLRRFLLPDDFQFRPPPTPGAMSQLLDRLLSSMPYPDDEFDVDNPSLTQFWKTTPWTATRHRMDLLYARTFEASNLTEHTLAAIDDLFGPMNVETLAQIIQFARFNAITNQRGRGEFVTREKLRQRWGGIPTLAIHGNRNGMVDVSTQDLLQEAMQDAGVPFRAIPSDRPPYDRIGHQDILIGIAAEAVFRDIEAFLEGAPDTVDKPRNRSDTTVDLGTAVPGCYFDWPWIGPRIDLPDGTATAPLRVAAMSSPDQGPARLVLVPAVKTTLNGQTSFNLPPNATASLSTSETSGHWLLATLAAPPQQEERSTSDEIGYLAAIVHDGSSVTSASVQRAHNFPFVSRQNAANDSAEPPALEAQCLLSAFRCWVERQTPDRLETIFLRQDELQRVHQLHETRKPLTLRFAFGSCQYPAGLFDREVAEASMRVLAASLNGAQSPDLILLLGDQIYADATGGVADATRIDERFEQPHVDALRMAPLRDVMRRRPVRALIDDHEISDNWEPLPADVALGRAVDAQRDQQAQRAGRDAFLRYQRMRPAQGRDRNTILDRPVDEVFDFAGHPFYLVDTRTGRSARGSSTAPDERLIIDDHQWFALRDWLLKHRNTLKFVAMSSVLLARRRRTADCLSEEGASSDAWDGFPESLKRLIEFLYFNRITNTVFLSGDEHHSFYSEAIVSSANDPYRLKILSVHSSALYAPFPFANGRPTDFLAHDDYPVGLCSLAVSTTLAPPGDGYAVIDVDVSEDQQPPTALTLRYVKSPVDAPTPASLRLSLVCATPQVP